MEALIEPIFNEYFIYIDTPRKNIFNYSIKINILISDVVVTVVKIGFNQKINNCIILNNKARLWRHQTDYVKEMTVSNILI